MRWANDDAEAELNKCGTLPRQLHYYLNVSNVVLSMYDHEYTNLNVV